MSRATPEAQSLVKALMELPENCMCADCQHKVAKWASTTLGVFICIDCSGIHRNLGTHITLVRSCTLDSWTPEQAKVMKRVGNRIGNQYWEANLPRDFVRPASTDRLNMESFIRSKYIQRLWAAPGDPPHLQSASYSYFSPLPVHNNRMTHNFPNQNEYKSFMPFSKSNNNLHDIKKSSKNSSMNLNDFMKMMSSNEDCHNSSTEHSKPDVPLRHQRDSQSEETIKPSNQLNSEHQLKVNSRTEQKDEHQIIPKPTMKSNEVKHDIKKMPTPAPVKGSTAQEIMMMANSQKQQRAHKFAKRNKDSNAEIGSRPSNNAVFEQMLQMTENSNRPESAPILQATKV